MEVVRRLNLDDLEQMISLRIELQEYDLIYVEDNQKILKKKDLIEKTKAYFERHLNNDLYMFGVFIDDELISNCGFFIDEHFPTFVNESGLVGYICNVFTKEKYRKKGYQKKVFDVCFRYAKEMGITNFKLNSRNKNAINMYKTFGFSISNSTYSFKVK